MAKEKLTISLAPDLLKLVKKIAKAEGKPVSQIVEMAARKFQPVPARAALRTDIVNGKWAKGMFNALEAEIRADERIRVEAEAEGDVKALRQERNDLRAELDALRKKRRR